MLRGKKCQGEATDLRIQAQQVRTMIQRAKASAFDILEGVDSLPSRVVAAFIMALI